MNTIAPQTTNSIEALNESAKRPYVAPTLTHLGDLRDLTLGSSPGVGDSGSAGSFKCPGCP